LRNFRLRTKTYTFKNKNSFHTFGYDTLDYLLKFWFTEERRVGKRGKGTTFYQSYALKRGYYCNVICKLSAVPSGVCYNLLRLHEQSPYFIQYWHCLAGLWYGCGPLACRGCGARSWRSGISLRCRAGAHPRQAEVGLKLVQAALLFLHNVVQY